MLTGHLAAACHRWGWCSSCQQRELRRAAGLWKHEQQQRWAEWRRPGRDGEPGCHRHLTRIRIQCKHGVTLCDTFHAIVSRTSLQACLINAREPATIAKIFRGPVPYTQKPRSSPKQQHGAAQAPEGSALFVDSGSEVVSTSPSLALSSIGCSTCEYKAPGATTFQTLSTGAAPPLGGSGSSGAQDLPCCACGALQRGRVTTRGHARNMQQFMVCSRSLIASDQGLRTESQAFRHLVTTRYKAMSDARA